MARPRPRILLFSGSIRAQSYNAKLAALVAKTVALRDAEATLISLGDYSMPIYDGDLEAESGVPEAAKRLHALITSHQGVFIASPEYNNSFTPLLKNTIDWVSRIRPESDRAPRPFKGRVYALGGASPGYYGGIRSLMHFRQVLELGLGATVIPEQVAVPSAATAFGEDGSLTGERPRALLDAMVQRLIDEAARYVSY